MIHFFTLIKFINSSDFLYMFKNYVLSARYICSANQYFVSVKQDNI